MKLRHLLNLKGHIASPFPKLSTALHRLLRCGLRVLVVLLWLYTYGWSKREHNRIQRKQRAIEGDRRINSEPMEPHLDLGAKLICDPYSLPLCTGTICPSSQHHFPNHYQKSASRQLEYVGINFDYFCFILTLFSSIFWRQQAQRAGWRHPSQYPGTSKGFCDFHRCKGWFHSFCKSWEWRRHC